MKLDLHDIDFLLKDGYDIFEINEMDYFRNEFGCVIYGYNDLAKWYVNEYVTDVYDSTFLVDSFNELPFEFITNKEELEKELKENDIVFETIYEDENLSRYIDIIEKYIDWEKYGEEIAGYDFGGDSIIPINDGEYFVS